MRSRRAKWLLGSLATLGAIASVLLCGGALGLRSPWFQGWLADTIVTASDEATHERTQLDSATVTFFPPGVAIEQLRLIDDTSGDQIVHAERIFAGLALREGKLQLGRLTVQGLRVHLHIDERGALREFTAPRSQPPTNPLTTLPWSSLALVDGEVIVDIPQGQVTLTQVQLVPGVGRQTRALGDLSVRWRDFTDSAQIDIADIELGPTSIEVANLTIATQALQIEGRATVPLQGELNIDLTLHSELDRLSPLLTGPRFLHGSADADVHIEGPVGSPRTHVVVALEQAGYRAPGKIWPEVHYHIDAATISADIVGDKITIEQAVIREKSGTAYASGQIERVEVSPGAPPQWYLVHSTVLGEDLSLADILRAVDAAPNPWVDFVADAEVQLSGPLSPLELSGSFELALADFVVKQGPEDDPASALVLGIPSATASGELQVFQDHLVLDCRSVHTPRNEGKVHANIGFAPKGPLDMSIDMRKVNLRDLRPLGGAELTGHGSVRGRLKGPFNALRFRGTGRLSDFSSNGVPYADRLNARITSDMKRLKLTDVDANIGSTHYLGEWQMDFSTPGMPMETDVLITSGRVLDLVNMFVDVSVVDGAIDEGTLQLEGPLNALNGEAHIALSQVDLLGERFETGRADGYMHDGTFTLEDLRVRRGDDEGLTLSGSVGREWALQMDAVAEIKLENLRSVKEWSVPLTGRATATVRLDQTLFDPAPHGRVVLWKTTFAERPVSDSLVSFETHHGLTNIAGELVGNTVSVDMTVGLWDEQPYDVHTYFDSFPIDRLYPVAADGQEVIATLTGDIHAYGNVGPEPSDVVVKGEFPRVVFGWDRHTLINDKLWTFSMEGDRWDVDGISLFGSGSSGRLTAQGRGGVNFVHGQGTLDADLLRAIVPGLYRSKGVFDVSVASIGKGGDANTHVDVDLKAELMRHDSFPAALEDVQLTAAITPDMYRLNHLQASVGGGELIGSAREVARIAGLFPSRGPLTPAGIIEAESWLPKRFDLHTRATDVQMKWVEDLPPAVGNATASFDGPVDELLLRSDVQVTEMAFTDRIDWEDWVVALEEYLLVEAPPAEEDPWFGLAINIEADRTIRLLNNVSDATASADLQIVGNTSRMGLLGRVSVEDGDVFVQDRSFAVKRGELIFDNPYSWDPLLDFDLQTDIQSRQRQYRVNYRILGPYSSWSSRTRSDPPLPQSDINALLWFGVTADELEDMGELTNAVSMAAADFVFKDVFLQNDYLGLGLDRSDVLKRLPELDLNTGVNLRGEYSSEPRVLLKQRLSPELLTQAEFNFLGDEYFVRIDWRADQTLVLSSWWASRQRKDLNLPFSGAIGGDVRWIREFD